MKKFILTILISINVIIIYAQQTENGEAIKFGERIQKLKAKIDTLNTEIEALVPLYVQDTVSAHIKRLNDSLIDNDLDSVQTTKIIEKLKVERRKQEGINEIEIKRGKLNEEIKSLNQTILIFSQLKDFEDYSAEVQKDILDAQQRNKYISSNAVESFAGTAKIFEQDATTRTALLVLAEGMIILPDDENKAAAEWLERFADAAAIVIGMWSYNSFENNNQVSGGLLAAGGLLVLATKQISLNSRSKEDSSASTFQQIAEAFARNIMFGSIIRDDQENLRIYKAHVDSLINSIPFYPEDSVLFVSPGYFPSDTTLNIADLILEDVSNAIFFHRKINVEAKNLIAQHNDILSDESKAKLNNIISDHEDIMKLLHSNRTKLSTQIRFLRSIDSDKNRIGSGNMNGANGP